MLVVNHSPHSALVLLHVALLLSALQAAMAESARGLRAWRAALCRGLLPDDEALRQLAQEGDAPGGSIEGGLQPNAVQTHELHTIQSTYVWVISSRL